MANELSSDFNYVINAGISEELYAIDHVAKKGAEARLPIANALDKINNSFDDVISLVDEEGNSYNKNQLLTAEKLYQYFSQGKGYLKRPPKNYQERERAMTGGAIWSELETVSSLLDKIIGGTTSGS